MKLLLCDPPAPLPGQALAPWVRMGRGSQRVQKRALLGSIWIQEVWSKIEVAAPWYYRYTTDLAARKVLDWSILISI